ncbi:MAG: hypothetical protein KGJ43_01380 [Acidobacteriota bacterium]|nr:hypothetical protein [Acidobacteriota bacterium]
MNQLVVDCAIAVAALNGLPALAGAWLWHREQEARAFWTLLRTAQVAELLFALGIGVLAAGGRYASEHLFYLYALLPIAVAFIAEQLRITAAQTVLDRLGLEGAAAVGELPETEQRAVVHAILRREMAIMALSALVVAILALRAASTAHGL